MLVAFIIGGEFAFWLLLGGGLLVRYVLRMRRTSAAMLLATPIVDVVLLIATAVDLRNGGEASWAHGLAAAYLGFSVAFGHRTIRWADARVAYRFAGGPQPPKPPPSPGWARVRHEWVQWLRMVLAAVIACGLLLAAIAYVGDGATDELWGWMARVGLITGVWLVGWPVWETGRTLAASPDRRAT